MGAGLLSLLLPDLIVGALRAALCLAVGAALTVLCAAALLLSAASAVLSPPPSGPARWRAPADVAGSPAAGSIGDVAGVVQVARGQLGAPYVWGAADPRAGFDCSGLVQWSFRRIGVALPRTAQLQHDATEPVLDQNLQPGDLVFFAGTYFDPHDWITHVGIYAGNGQMINAPREGEPVQEMPVFSGFWRAHYAGAGRVTTRPALHQGG